MGVLKWNEIEKVSSTLFVRQKKQAYMVHDRLFKELIGVFFEDFLEAFFPEVHAQIDFQKITPLSEEVFADLYDGNKKVLDLVVEVKWKDTDSVIVIHVEPQSTKQKDFQQRMFRYFSLLYNKLGKPIIPIAVFSYEEAWEENEFTMRFADLKILHFHYLTLHIRKQNWRLFMKKENPVSAALMSKMGYSEAEKVQVKLEFFKILTRLQLDMEKRDLLIGFFESYLKLNEAEEEIFVKEAKRLDNADEILELPISYVEKGKALGREEGREEGRKEQKREFALSLLNDGFSVEKVTELTKLSVREVEKLRELQ